MKKLSNITESVWTDIQDRSSGNVIRREDDIDIMDKYTFCEYLKDNYDSETDYAITTFDADDKDELNVNVFRNQNQSLFFTLEVDDFNNNPYVALRPVPGVIKPLQDKLEDRYDVWEDRDDDSGNLILVINPKDGSDYSNKFFLDVLDFVLDNVPKPLIQTLGRKVSVSESRWTDIQKRSSGEEIRREDIKPQDYEYWWRNIPLDNAPKYKKEELRLWDFLYNLIIWPLEKTMNIKTPEEIDIYFKYEDAWYLSIHHNTAHGADNYTMEAKGVRHYNPIKYSEMGLPEKRSIKYRLETKKFYIYTYKNGYYTEYYLREEDNYNGQKGILMK